MNHKQSLLRVTNIVLILATILAASSSVSALGYCAGSPKCPKKILFSCLLGALACAFDPQNVEDFSLSVQFNPKVLQFASISFFAPFTETTPPDLSQLSLGLILHITGSTTTPPPGDVFIFEVFYNAVVPGATPVGNDTIFASTGDFIDTIDPATGVTMHFDSSQIPATTCPEPGSLILVGTGLLGAVGLLRRKFAT